MKSSSDINVKNEESSDTNVKNSVTTTKQVVKEKCKDESDSDSYCYTINEEPQTSVSLDVEEGSEPQTSVENDSEALKPSTVSVPQTEDKIIEENEPVVVKVNVIPDHNADELLIKASLHENDLDDKRDEGADITLNQQTSITQNPQNSYVTEFFVQMVTKFLSQSCLHYLLSDDEMKLTKAFMNLDPFEMKILFVRLYWLQWKWHKVETIQKYIHSDRRPEFVNNLLKNLEAKGFILTGQQMNFNEFLEIASFGELKTLMIKIPQNLLPKPSDSGEPKTKQAMIERIKNIYNAKGQDSILKNMSSVLVQRNLIKIQELAQRTFNFLHSLMYLGANPQLLRDKSLNRMLLKVRNGKQLYPAMGLECDLPSCIFLSRLHFLEYEQAYSLAEYVLNLTKVEIDGVDSTVRGQQVLDACRECHNSFKLISQQEESAELKLLPWLHRFTPGYQYVRAMELSIRALKAFDTEEMDLEVLEVLQTLLDQTTYRQHKRAQWYFEQTSILLKNEHYFTRVAEILILALNESSMNEDEKAPLRDRAEKLATQTTVKIDTHVVKLLKGLSKVDHVVIPSIDIAAKGDGRKIRAGIKDSYYFDDGKSGDRKFVSIEKYVLLYYQNFRDFDCGKHWEGRIITSIFNLLFWDIIYTTVKDKWLFLSPYQEVPLDMYTPYFYENRKELIDERLAFIETSSLAVVLDKMKTTLDTKKPGDFSLHSDQIDWDQLLPVSVCLGNAGLHSICKRLALNYHYALSGFPNLTIWNSETNQIKFVEVKYEGDKLSFKQIQWIHYLMESNVSAEVCYVHRNDRKYRKKMADNLKASIAVTRDTDDNQNNKKIRARSKRCRNRRVELSQRKVRKISKDSIATEIYKDSAATDRVEITEDSFATEISKDSIATDRVEIPKDMMEIPEDSIATDRVKIPKDGMEISEGSIATEISKDSIATDRVEIPKDVMEISEDLIATDSKDSIATGRVEIPKDAMEISEDLIATENSKDSIATDRVEIPKEVMKISEDSIATDSKDSIATDRVEIPKDIMEISKDSIATDRVKIPKDVMEISEGLIATEISKDSIATDRVEIPKDVMEISKEPVGIDRVEIFKNPIAPEKVNINNEPICKSIKILSPTLTNHTNVVTSTTTASSNDTNPPSCQTTSNLPMNTLDFPVQDLIGFESTTKEENKFISSPAKVATRARRRLEGLGSPGTSSGSIQEEEVYLRSPSKISRRVDYVSPPTSPKTFISPSKTTSARKKLNLSLTRRRLKDIDN